MTRTPLTLCATLLLLCGCRALTPTTRDGWAGNLVAAPAGPLAYVSLGGAGLAVVDAETGAELARLRPPPGCQSVDDLALADGVLFALDAQPPGAVALLGLDDPRRPAPLAPALEVPVGPFSGVAAAPGRAVVSGGTSPLTVLGWRRLRSGGGELRVERQVEVAYGQPDVLLSADGARAYVSTHFSLPLARYGVTILDTATGAPLGRLELPGAGFTPGVTRPANFPIEGALLDPDTLLVAHGAGLAVIDVRDPTAPRLRALLPLPMRAVNVDCLAGRAAVVGSDPLRTLVLVDLRDPDRPRIERSVPLPAWGRPTGVACAGGRVLVAAQAAGTVVVPEPGA